MESLLFWQLRAPDFEKKNPTSFPRYLEYLKGHPATAIRVGDGFLLAHSPDPDLGKLYSFKHGDRDDKTFPLDAGGEQALLSHVATQI
jgi:hypothetical protein